MSSGRMESTMVVTSVTTLRTLSRDVMVEPRVVRTSVARQASVQELPHMLSRRLTDLDDGGDALKGSADLSEDELNSGVQVNQAADINDLAGLEAADGAADGVQSIGGDVASSGDGARGDGDHIAEDVGGLFNDTGNQLGDGGDLYTNIDTGGDIGQLGGVCESQQGSSMP